MSTITPDLPFGAQLIGRSEKSLDAILQRVLTGSGLSEPEYVAMRVCADHAGTERVDIEAQLAAAFRKGTAHAAALLDGLTDKAIITADARGSIELTAHGRQLHDRMTAETAGITQRLWGDLPADDLAVAGRVLSTVMRRAAAEPA